MAQTEQDSKPVPTPNEAAPLQVSGAAAPSAPGRTHAVAVWLVLVLIALLTAGGGYLLWWQIDAQGARVGELATAAQEQRNEQRQLAAELANSLARFEQTQAGNQAAFADFVGKVESQLNAQGQQLAQMTAASRTQFLLSEAQFLVRQASQRLQLERAPASAIGLFQLADQLLAKVEAELGNPAALLDARKQLARDLGQLQNLQAVDYTGVFFAIDSILTQVDNLALAQPPREFANEEVEPAVIHKNPHTLWAKITVGWRNFTRELASYVRVRRLEEPVEPLLSPDQETRVRENLKLKLQVAQLALLRADGKLYGDNLTLAHQWLAEYFPVSIERNHMMEQLEALAARSVNSELPDISATARSLDQFINQYRNALGVHP